MNQSKSQNNFKQNKLYENYDAEEELLPEDLFELLDEYENFKPSNKKKIKADPDESECKKKIFNTSLTLEKLMSYTERSLNDVKKIVCNDDITRHGKCEIKLKPEHDKNHTFVSSKNLDQMMFKTENSLNIMKKLLQDDNFLNQNQNYVNSNFEQNQISNIWNKLEQRMLTTEKSLHNVRGFIKNGLSTKKEERIKEAADNDQNQTFDRWKKLDRLMLTTENSQNDIIMSMKHEFFFKNNQKRMNITENKQIEIFNAAKKHEQLLLNTDNSRNLIRNLIEEENLIESILIRRKASFSQIAFKNQDSLERVNAFLDGKRICLTNALEDSRKKLKKML